jgi:endonuclease/exonuclease/phosphatase family metal-dependent hydrolase
MSTNIKKIIRVSIIAATITTIVFYLLSSYSPFLHSGRHTYFALIGLAFPILLLLIMGFLIYWLIRKSRWAFVCIITLLLGFQQITVLLSFHTGKKFDAAKTATTLRVLSWNLSSWGESNKSGLPKGRDECKEEMINEIRKSNADVLCLQEFLYYENSVYLDSVIPAFKEMGYEFIYFAKKDYTGYFYPELKLTGIEIMSKFPIVDAANFIYNDEDVTEPLIYADIKINSQTIRFFTTHLESVRFGSEDYDAINQLKKSKINIRQSRTTGGKLKIAYRKRAMQAEILHNKIKESPYPVIVCGDFNDVPNSYTYFTIKGNLQDAFLKKGTGLGRTFRFISPTLRIDYILADKKFEVAQFNKLEVNYSDHYPVISDFILSKE